MNPIFVVIVQQIFSVYIITNFTITSPLFVQTNPGPQKDRKVEIKM